MALLDCCLLTNALMTPYMATAESSSTAMTSSFKNINTLSEIRETEVSAESASESSISG
ncbi:hypothetical protein MGSAQ_001404 [marine sediment metagenome]|uniref:Uncharacterized protein n=1 Tax=marine sediment metagenome TaxID=412755 RepID=A0A1B6NUR7_9ZZZZ